MLVREIFPQFKRRILHQQRIVRALFKTSQAFLHSVVTNHQSNNVDFIEFDLKSGKWDQHLSLNSKFYLHPIWLRHHCRCKTCYNATTYQRQLKVNETLLQSKIVNLEYDQDRNQLICKWADNHTSHFNTTWLNNNIPKLNKPIPSSDSIECSESSSIIPPKITPPCPFNDIMELGLDFQEFMSNETTLKKFLRDLIQWGFGVIKNAPPTAEATLESVQRISHQQRTMYGDGPTVTSSNLEYKDMAYTSEYLDLHTDTSYFSEPMGLQIFHLLSHEGTGGSNSISDAFHAAQILQEENPKLYSLLATTPITSEYFDAGNYFYSNTDVILSHNKFTKELECVRFNTNDMGVLKRINAEDLTSFYKGLVRFSEILAGEAKWIQLKPGTIIFLDNWRTLHGREEFTGERSMASVYVGRSDWMSRARILGLYL